jgi:hypothetical protein
MALRGSTIKVATLAAAVTGALLSGGCGAPAPSASRLEQRIAAEGILRAHALEAGDAYAASKHTLELDRATELRDGADPDRVERKYARLSEILATTPRERYDRISPIAYHPLELAAVREVTAAYGDLYVRPSAIDGAGTPQASELILDRRPWSGFWYPLFGTQLYEGADSPFAKLDRLAAALGRGGGTVAWEQAHHEAVPAAAWEGFCSAWATAAVRTEEPVTPRTYGGITFSPSDQKALLTKVHELYPVRQLGVRYEGDAATDGTYQDLRPEAFHELALHFLGIEQRSIVFDDDAGISVWSKPLYRLRWTVTADPDVEHAYLVKAFPWFIRHRNRIDDARTSDADLATAAFEYRLYVDPETTSDDGELVIAGEWLGRSAATHPDFALVPAVDGDWGSADTALVGSFSVVRELFERGLPP